MAAHIRPKRRAEADARRAQIVDAAIRAFGERGYRGVTVQQLAQSCGVTNGGLLHYFPSKEDVLIAVLEEFERRMIVGIMKYTTETVGAFDEAHSSREHVLHILRAMLVQARDDREILRLNAMLQIEALDPTHPAHDRIIHSSRTTFARFSKLFEPLCQEPVRTARQALAMMNGLLLMSLDDASFDLLAEWDHAIATILPDNAGRGKK